MAALLLQPTAWIERGSAAGLGHFFSLFKGGVEEYIRSVTSKAKPKLVVVCVLYFPSTEPDGSWADGPLGTLGYNNNPLKLQSLIRKVFAEATSQIEVDGIPVLPIPLYECGLDGSNPEDYVNRVEPSTQGGEKIARWVVDAIASLGDDGPFAACDGGGGSGLSAPSSRSTSDMDVDVDVGAADGQGGGT